MRIKLNFSLNENDLWEIENEYYAIPKELKKIVFPVNLNEVNSIAKLKWKINEFLKSLNLRNMNPITNYLSVEHLFLGDFLLLDEFRVELILNNDDEVNVDLRRKSIEYGGNISKKIKTNKKIHCVALSSEDESSSDENVKSITKGVMKNKQIRKPPNLCQRNIKQNNYSKVTVFNESDSSSEDVEEIKEIVIPKNSKFCSKKEPQSSKKKDNSCKFDLLIKQVDNTKSNYMNQSSKENIISNSKTEKRIEPVGINKIEKQFELIPSNNIENINFLRVQYPNIFIKGTMIMFRIYELSLQSGGLSPSDYKIGAIDEFLEENKCFIIKLQRDSYINHNDTIFNSFPSHYHTEDDYEEQDLISVFLKDFIELRIEKALNINQNNEETKTNVKENVEPKVETVPNKEKVPPQVIDNSQNGEISKEISNTDKNNLPKKKTVSVLDKIIHPYIKKQIEYYFSNKNYYKDKFLLEAASKDQDNFIDLSIIMGFNKIKSLTENKENIIQAIKDSNVIEFNEDFTKIRKQGINKEFLP